MRYYILGSFIFGLIILQFISTVLKDAEKLINTMHQKEQIYFNKLIKNRRNDYDYFKKWKKIQCYK